MIVRSYLMAALTILGTVAAKAQFVPIEWVPIEIISPGNNRVPDFGLTSSGDLYITSLRSHPGGVDDSFRIHVRKRGESRFKLVHDYSDKQRITNSIIRLHVAENSAYFSSSEGILRATSGIVDYNSAECKPPSMNVREIYAQSDSVLYFAAYDTLGLDPGAQGGYFSSNVLSDTGCRQLYRKLRSRHTGIGSGYASRTPTDVIEMFVFRSPGNDTMFRRVNGDGVYTDITVKDPGFEPMGVFGHPDGWVVVGTSKGLTETVYKLDTSFRVVGLIEVPKLTSGVGGSLRSLKMRGDHVTYATSGRVMVFDVSRMQCTEISVAALQTGLPDSSWGEMISDAEYAEGYLYVTLNVQGLRIFRDETTAAPSSDSPIVNNKHTVWISPTESTVLLPGEYSFAENLVCYDVTGRSRQLRFTASSRGLHISVEELFEGLNAIRVSNGSVYFVMR